MKYYEAGMDLRLSSDPEESFRLFQGLIRAEYDRLVDEFGLVRVDASQSLVQQQHEMRGIVKRHLAGVTRNDHGRIQDALRQAGLTGRYVRDGAGAWA